MTDGEGKWLLTDTILEVCCGFDDLVNDVTATRVLSLLQAIHDSLPFVVAVLGHGRVLSANLLLNLL